MRAGATRHQPLRFPGQEYDPLAPERAYNIFRWYRAGWGRYTQADPIGLMGGENLYAYVNGRPLTLKDPLGLASWCTDDFVWHYYNGGGAAVDLNTIGLLAAFRASDSVQTASGNFKNRAPVRARAKAQALCAGTDCGTKTGTFSLGGRTNTDVTWRPCLFSVGDSSFFMNANCNVKANCTLNTFNYSCSFSFKIRDYFQDPLGLNVEPGGTPYQINGGWSENGNGGGRFR